jgi:hypothetical protein
MYARCGEDATLGCPPFDRPVRARHVDLTSPSQRAESGHSPLCVLRVAKCARGATREKDKCGLFKRALAVNTVNFAGLTSFLHQRLDAADEGGVIFLFAAIKHSLGIQPGAETQEVAGVVRRNPDHVSHNLGC